MCHLLSRKGQRTCWMPRRSPTQPQCRDPNGPCCRRPSVICSERRLCQFGCLVIHSTTRESPIPVTTDQLRDAHLANEWTAATVHRGGQAMTNRKPAPEGPVARVQSGADMRVHLHRMIDEIDERATVHV